MRTNDATIQYYRLGAAFIHIFYYGRPIAANYLVPAGGAGKGKKANAYQLSGGVSVGSKQVGSGVLAVTTR